MTQCPAGCKYKHSDSKTSYCEEKKKKTKDMNNNRIPPLKKKCILYDKKCKYNL